MHKDIKAFGIYENKAGKLSAIMYGGEYFITSSRFTAERDE